MTVCMIDDLIDVDIQCIQQLHKKRRVGSAITAQVSRLAAAQPPIASADHAYAAIHLQFSFFARSARIQLAASYGSTIFRAEIVDEFRKKSLRFAIDLS